MSNEGDSVPTEPADNSQVDDCAGASSLQVPASIPVHPDSPTAEVVGSNLSQLAIKRAYDELAESEATRAVALTALRELVTNDAQLSCRTDNAFLIKFLRHRKFNVERAHQKIRAYLQVRNTMSDVFANFNPGGVRAVLEGYPNLFCLLPERDSEGRLLVMCRVGAWDCDGVSRTDLLRTVNGVSVILDLHGLSWHQILTMKRDSYLKRLKEVVSKALPVRVKQIHLMRGGRIFDVAFKIFSFLLSAKMRQRVLNHGSSVASLHKAIEPRLLPIEQPFCGTMDSHTDESLRLRPFKEGRFDLLSGRWDAWFEANNKQKHPANPQSQTMLCVEPVLNSASNSPEPPPVGSRLSPLAAQRAAQELGETDSTRGPALAALRDLVTKDVQLRGFCRTDDAFLIKFLRHRKFNVESAHQRIRAYLQVRNSFPDVFANFTPSGVLPLLESGVVSLLPVRDIEGRRLVLYRVGRWDCSKFSSTELVRANGVVIEAALHEEDTQVNGIAVLLDLSDLSLRQLRKLDMDYLKRFRAVVNKALPVRVKALNIIKGGKFFNASFKLASALMSKKLVDRVQNHGDSVTALHSRVDANLLPKEAPFNGQMDYSVPYEPFVQHMRRPELEAWFRWNNCQRLMTTTTTGAPAGD
uniref:CRAL-TRIO domain-containing protein n=1 Tax=Macrostomum lignano TaxID=282301 RepID=A0A1I8GQX6_9PLAT